MDDFFDGIGDNAQGVEEKMNASGGIPPGYYRVKLNGAKQVQAKDKDDGTPGLHGMELTFIVTEGPYKDREITDKLWKSDKEAAVNRINMFAYRLGLKKKSADGKKFETITGKTGFLDALDTEVILHIKHEPDSKDANKSWPRFEWNGLPDPKDPAVIEALKNGGQPPAKSAAGAKPAADKTPAKKKTTLDKL